MKAVFEFDLQKEEVALRRFLVSPDMVVTLVRIKGLMAKAIEEEWDKGRVIEGLENIFQATPFDLSQLIE